MQINTWWLPKLQKFGIGEEQLYDPCVNVNVGAWVLAQNFQTFGPTWKAVGAYNARSVGKQIVYVRTIQIALGISSATGQETK